MDDARVVISIRDDRLLDILRSRGTVSVVEMSQVLGLSPSSVRRDLSRLARAGQVVRTYGGAAVVDRPALAAPRDAVRALAEKRRIAAAAAAMVGDGQTIAITSGTTCHELARQLTGRSDLTVITNSLDVANELIDRSGIQLIVLGGVARPGMHSLLGHLTEQACRELRADTLFMGIGAVSSERGLMNDYLPEVLTDRAIRPMATSVVLLADSSKFGSVGPAFVFGLEEVAAIVTDAGIRPEVKAALERRGIQVVIG
jgi:DeoR family transcriptional regulator of aga operon